MVQAKAAEADSIVKVVRRAGNVRARVGARIVDLKQQGPSFLTLFIQRALQEQLPTVTHNPQRHITASTRRHCDRVRLDPPYVIGIIIQDPYVGEWIRLAVDGAIDFAEHGVHDAQGAVELR